MAGEEGEGKTTWEIRTDMFTLPGGKPPYSTGSSTQGSVMT